jgi:hypothetical protein
MLKQCARVKILVWLAVCITACGGDGRTNANKQLAASSAGEKVIDITVKADQECARDSSYTLMITGGDRVPAPVLEQMVCTFFEVYPHVVKLLNPQAPNTVQFSFSPTIDYPAGAINNQIVFSSTWMNRNPLDTDIVVHELTHVVQADLGKVPGWVVEGTADYVRDLYGLRNIENGWSIPNRYEQNQHYADGYGTAAAFFKWIDAVYRQNVPSTVETIYAFAADALYDEQVWVTITGKQLDTLWHEYKNYPVTPPFESGISVFLSADYKGREIKLGRGNYDLAELLSLAIPDNEIASIKVPEGYKLKIYSDVNFAGEMLDISADVSKMPENFVRKISSVVVE